MSQINWGLLSPASRLFPLRLAAPRVSDRPFVGGIPMSENRSSATLVVNREGEFADAEKLHGTRGRFKLRHRAPPTDPFGGSDQPIVL